MSSLYYKTKKNQIWRFKGVQFQAELHACTSIHTCIHTYIYISHIITWICHCQHTCKPLEVKSSFFKPIFRPLAVHPKFCSNSIVIQNHLQKVRIIRVYARYCTSDTQKLSYKLPKVKIYKNVCMILCCIMSKPTRLGINRTLFPLISPKDKL